MTYIPEKALKEEVIPHIKRDISKIEVEEVLVADETIELPSNKSVHR